MIFINQGSSINNPILLVILFTILFLSFFVLRKFANYEYNKKENLKAFALTNINDIESIMIKGSSEVICIIKLKGKDFEIAAQGVEAVRFYNKIIKQRPELDKFN